MDLKNKKLNVCLLGASLDTGNMGVSALSVSLMNLISDINPAAEISLLVPNKKIHEKQVQLTNGIKTINIINYRLSPRSKFSEHILGIYILALLYKIIPSKTLQKGIINKNPFLREIYNSDFIGDIYSGDSFSDIYGLARFVYSILPRQIVILLKKKYALLPQTYGPYKSWLSKQLARCVLQNAEHIISRDNDSLTLVEQILKRKKNKPHLSHCPDVAFMLNTTIPQKMPIDNLDELRKGGRLIGINISGLLYNGGYTKNNMFNLKFEYKDFIKNLLNRLLAVTDVKIILVPHTFPNQEQDSVENDYFACRKVYETLIKEYQKRVFVIPAKYDQSELKWIISHCSFFIGSRMHSCIAALSQNIPTIGIAYSKKFTGVFSSVGAEKLVINGRTAEMDASIDYILQSYSEREYWKEILEKNLDSLRLSIKKTFESLLLISGTEKA